MCKTLLITILSIFSVLNSCSKDNDGSNYLIKNISVTNALTMIEDNSNDENFIIIDIRTPAEYNSVRIENSILIDYYSSDFEEQLSKLDKDKKYLVYCRSANRSSSAMSLFKKLKFKEGYNMENGINSWIKKGFKTISGK